jgi:hypothetical protein
MSTTPEGKPVDLVVTDPFKHDGRHWAIGEIVPQVKPELAKELAGNGRARLATDEDRAAVAKAAKKNG